MDDKRFETLLIYCHGHENAVYRLHTGDKIVLAYYDTDYESDNGLDEEDAAYEEYQCIAFRNVNTGRLFEISYHNLPDEILAGQDRII